MPEPATVATRPPTDTTSFYRRALAKPRHPVVLRISDMASGVSIVYALRIKDEPRRHDVRLSRPITGRGAPPICRRHLR